MRERYLTQQRFAYYDDFERPAGSLSGQPLAVGGTTWQTVNTINYSGTSTAVQAASDSNVKFALVNSPTASPKLWLKIGNQVGTLATRPRLIFNYVDQFNFWAFTPSGSVDGEYFLFNVIAGITTVVQTRSAATGVKTNQDFWRAEVNDDTVQTFVNNVLVNNYTVASRPLKTATLHGFGFGATIDVTTSVDAWGIYNQL